MAILFLVTPVLALLLHFTFATISADSLDFGLLDIYLYVVLLSSFVILIRLISSLMRAKRALISSLKTAKIRIHFKYDWVRVNPNLCQSKLTRVFKCAVSCVWGIFLFESLNCFLIHSKKVYLQLIYGITCCSRLEIRQLTTI